MCPPVTCLSPSSAQRVRTLEKVGELGHHSSQRCLFPYRRPGLVVNRHGCGLCSNPLHIPFIFPIATDYAWIRSSDGKLGEASCKAHVAAESLAVLTGARHESRTCAHDVSEFPTEDYAKLSWKASEGTADHLVRNQRSHYMRLIRATCQPNSRSPHSTPSVQYAATLLPHPAERS